MFLCLRPTSTCVRERRALGHSLRSLRGIDFSLEFQRRKGVRSVPSRGRPSSRPSGTQQRRMILGVLRLLSRRGPLPRVRVVVTHTVCATTHVQGPGVRRDLSLRDLGERISQSRHTDTVRSQLSGTGIPDLDPVGLFLLSG